MDTIKIHISRIEQMTVSSIQMKFLKLTKIRYNVFQNYIIKKIHAAL